MRWVPHLRVERDGAATTDGTGDGAGTRAMAGATAYLVPGRRAGPLLERTWLRATAEAARGAGVHQGALTVSRQLSRIVQVEATALWSPGAHGPLVALTVTTNHDALRAYTTLAAARGAPATATQLVQGSVVHDRGVGRRGAGARDTDPAA